MSRVTIDINCDLGERNDTIGITGDLSLIEWVTSVNIACGGHAGDDQSMTRTAIAAIERGVALGAHPSYPDRTNFGRAAFRIAPQALEDSIAHQVETLMGIIDRCGGTLAHVKPHGSLYHAAMRQRDVAECVARGVARVTRSVRLVGQASTPALEHWRGLGWRVVREAFADRRYAADGSLLARDRTDAVITTPAIVAAQAVDLAMGRPVRTLLGEPVKVEADSLCVHSDSLNAVETAREVRAALERAGVRVKAM